MESDKKKFPLTTLQKYKVLLSRIDISPAYDIEWL
ncbi:tail fiber assembly protein [Photorhabdus antumapuensis]